VLSVNGFGQLGMVATLFQFDNNVEEGARGAFDTLPQSVVVLGQNPLVILLLDSSHLNTQNLLHFGG